MFLINVTVIVIQEELTKTLMINAEEANCTSSVISVCIIEVYGLTCDLAASSNSFITEGLGRYDFLAIIRAVSPSCDDDHMKG